MKYPLGLIVLFCFIPCNPLMAEEIRTPVGQQMTSPNLDMPVAGLSKITVESQYGTPIEMNPAVGKPPISRWIYRDYTVYFENDRVIHSVQHPQ